MNQQYVNQVLISKVRRSARDLMSYCVELLNTICWFGL